MGLKRSWGSGLGMPHYHIAPQGTRAIDTYPIIGLNTHDELAKQ